MAIVVAGGGIAWYVTRNIAYFYSGVFYAFIPLSGLIYFHFVLFNRRRNPLETQRRVENILHQNQTNARAVALVNGSLLLLASPLLIVVGVIAGAEYGIAGAIIGGVIGSIWLAGGILLVNWRRRRRPKSDGD